MHEEHSSFYAFQNQKKIYILTQTRLALEYLAFYLFAPKTNKKPPCCKTAILQIAAIPHPFIIQCTNWSHIPTRCHEEQKKNKDKLANSSSKTREIECLHSPISMNATYKHKTHKTNKRLF
jgi:hypothetical protein